MINSFPGDLVGGKYKLHFTYSNHCLKKHSQDGVFCRVE